MRRVDSWSSLGQAARGERRGDPAEPRRRVAGPAAAATRSSQSSSRPAARERLGELPRLGDAELLAGARAARPRRRRRRARRAPSRPSARAIASRCSATSASASSRSMPASTNRPHRRAHDVERLGQLRRGAARGRRRVVELVRQPGGHRAERGEPLAVLLDAGEPAHHRRDLAASRAGAPRAARARAGGSRRARSVASAARRLGGMRTGTGASVSTAIAPIQVGARWRPTGSARSPSSDHAPSPCPRAAARRPAGIVALLGDAPRRRLDVALASTATHSASSASSRSSNRSTGAQVGDGGPLMRRPGTGG